MGRLRQRLVVVTSVIAAATAQAAQAQVKTIDIPAQPAATAVVALGHQADVQIVAARKVTNAKRTNAVRGDFTPAQALSRMLDGTGLIAEQTGPQTYAVVQRPRTLLASVTQVTASDAVPAPTIPRSATVPSADVAQTASSSSDEGATEPEDLVVTGSRLVQNGFKAPTPVTVLSAQSLEQHAARSIPEALRELPALIKTASNRAAPLSTAGDPGATAGTFLNLRNLGSQRTLLLQDGMRVPPTRSDGLTDANVIPQMLVSRVEVVTGGASAAYGSDAVSGVVNYIMDNRFTGIKGVAQAGSSERGDGRNYRIGLAAGRSFLDDRLHVVASAEHRIDEGIDSFCAREWGCDNYLLGGVNGPTGAGTAANPYTPYANVRVARVTLDGYIGGVFNASAAGGISNTVNAAANTQLAGRNLVYQPGGAVLAPYRAGTLITPNNCIDCDGGARHAASLISLVPRQTTSQIFARTEYDVTPAIKIWAQGSYARSHIRQTIGSHAWFGNSGGVTVRIYSGNAFLSPAVQTVLTSTGANTFELDSYRAGDLGDIPNGTFDGLAQNRTLTLGAQGRLGGTWEWKAYGVKAESSARYSGRVAENSKFYAALDAVRDPTGTIVCRVTVTNPGLYPGCAPLNLFGVGSPSQEAINYILGRYVAKQTTTLEGFGGQVTARPFSTWAGPVGIALGYERRKQALDVMSNMGDPIANTGIRYGNGGTQRYRANDTKPTNGSYTVGEVFGEADIPLLQDVSLGTASIVRRLNVNAAARLTDYSTSGKVNSWKIGASWEVNDDLRFRVTRSRDIRAPTLNDLFAPVQSTIAIFTDPHTNNTLNNLITISQGNVDLKPEKADTWTVGGVLSPSFIPGLTTSVDWYSINVTDAIQAFGAAQLIPACESSNGTSSLCAGVERPLPFSDRSPQNFPTRVFAQSYNAVQLIVKGIDAEASYRRNVLGGEMNLRALATYQYDYESQASPQNPLVNSAGYNVSPKLIMTASVGYRKGPVGVDFRTRRIGVWSQAAPPGTTGAIQYFQDPKVGAIYYSDLAMTYDLKIGSSKRMQLFADVRNLFDRKPPLIANNITPGLSYPTARALYDVVLRDYSVGLRFQY